MKAEDEFDVRSLGSTLRQWAYVGAHSHPWAQLVFASFGVMRVSTNDETWLIPATQCFDESRLHGPDRIAFAAGRAPSNQRPAFSVAVTPDWQLSGSASSPTYDRDEAQRRPAICALFYAVAPYPACLLLLS